MNNSQVGNDLKISGAALSGLAQNMLADELQEIMASYMNGDINIDAWYPAQMCLDIFNEIRKGKGASSKFVAIGIAMVDAAIPPEGFENADLPMMLAMWDQHYKMNHQGTADIGGVTVERIGEKHIQVNLDIIYPDDLGYGATYAYARKSLSKDAHFTVAYDENEPRKEEGGNRTVIHVQW